MGLTWERRLVLWLPRPLLFGAFLIAAFLSVTYLLFQWSFGFEVSYVALLLTMFIAFVLMSLRWELVAEALERQRHGMELPVADRRELEIQVLRLPRDKIRRSRLRGAMGVLMMAGIVQVIIIFSQPDFDLLDSWIEFNDGSAGNVLALLLGWFVGRRSIYSPWPLPQPADVDLLDLEVLYATGRSGLHNALYVFVFLSLGSLVYLDPSLGLGLWGALTAFLLGVVLALWSLLRPALRVRHLIQVVKHEELEKLKAPIRQARDDTLMSNVANRGRLTDLLAYKVLVESTREWSFDSSTLLRFGLYLLIPVASMVGGALVERIVDVVLD